MQGAIKYPGEREISEFSEEFVTNLSKILFEE